MGMKHLTSVAMLCMFMHFLIMPVFSQEQKRTISFKKAVLTTDFIAEGVAVADVNKDGKKDVLAGSHWFQAPGWKKMTLAEPKKFKTTEYGNAFLHFAADVNQDGWTDFIRVDFPGHATMWHENPAGKKRYWKQHLLYSSVGNESPSMYDVDNDGKDDFICNNSNEKKMVWLKAPASANDSIWKENVISSDTLIGTHQFTHGLGFGDINGDGRKDVVIREGWWEAPEDRTQSNWTFHKADLGAECAQMYVRDFDGDGDSDVLSSSAHRYGIWWYEQARDGDSTRWIKHDIYNGLAQTHSLVMADIDGDGDEDFITGKRYYAHNGNDPGENEPAMLYWFEFKPGKKPEWIRHEVDNDSGAGINFVVEDINSDKLPDIIISNKKGVYVFTQQRK
jgi:hypothetical protein